MTHKILSLKEPLRLSLRHPPVMHLRTTAWTFTLWWFVLFLLHTINVIYYVGAATVYHLLLGTNVAFELSTYSIAIAFTEYPNISRVHWIVAALHTFFLVAMVGGSLQAKRLVFRPSILKWMTMGGTRMGRAWTTTRSRVMKDESVTDDGSTRISTATTLLSYVFSRDGILGVDYVYFDHLHLAREFVETILQLIQAYRMTYLLPRLWLIRFYVVLLIVNCWSTPFLHRYYHNRHVDRRFMSLLCDAILDTMSSIGVSSIIFATYAPQYTDPDYGFPYESWYDDVWFTNMQQEFQMMMVVSWADLASRLVFAAGLLQCMESIKDFLTPIERQAPRKSVEAIKPSAVGPAEALIETTRRPSVPGQPSSLSIKRLIHFLLEKVGPVLFMTLGCGILITHSVAETRALSPDIPCRLPLHPWFVKKPACSLVELDCHYLQISGSQDSWNDAWHAFELSTTVRLFVRHCPQLEVPAALQQFHQLTAVKLYNCTVASWDDTAALTAALHPKMRALFFIRTMFLHGKLPSGLFTTNFPPRLTNVITSATNLQTLPDNLHESWPSAMTLAFERSQMNEVPSELIKLNAFVVSFAGSPITKVPAELFEGSLLCCVVLISTHVHELPRIVPNPSPGLFLLYLDDTDISTFWSWMDPILNVESTLPESFIGASGTPFCTQRDEILTGKRTNFTTNKLDVEDLASIMDVSTPAKLGFSTAAVSCRPTDFFFPLEPQDASTALGE